MHIVHIVQSLDPAWGGMARVLPMLAGELVAAGDACTIATLHGGRFGRPPALEGVDVLAFAPKRRSPFGSSGEFNRRLPELLGACDVVHLHGLWTGQNRAAGRAARRAGKPYIMTPHSMMMPWAWQRSAWKKRPAGWLFEHRNLRNAACLHALADGEAEHIRTLGFNDRIEVIPNGLHTRDYESLPSADGLVARFPELAEPRWLLFLGRIHPQKGVVEMLRACFDVLAADEGWHLVIAGPDEIGMQPTLEAAIARKKLDHRVTFTGLLNREDVLAALGRATMLLQPSQSEGLSMSILEALAAGLPVLISTECNLPEVRTADAGRIVTPTRGGIATALRELVRLPDEELKAMGERGRALACERFDWSAVIPRYREMYARVAGA